MAKRIPKIVKLIQQVPPRGISWGTEIPISYSQLNIFNNCQHSWKVRYKDKVKIFTSTIHTVFGTAIHEVIQEYLKVYYDKNAVIADKLDLHEMFKNKLREEYINQYKKNSNTHFSSPEELNEFYEDGIGILDYIKKHKSKYFKKRHMHLVGVEIPVNLAPVSSYSKVRFIGYIDLVLYDEKYDRHIIMDIKTSTKGWSKWEKEDETKIHQVLLYKKFYSDMFKVDIDKIDVQFFIVKRKVMDINDENIMSPYQARNVQEYKPTQGKIKVNKAFSSLKYFIENNFTQGGEFKENDFPKNPNHVKCKWCPLYNTSHCDVKF